MTELICINKEKITESFVTKFAMEKVDAHALLFCVPLVQVNLSEGLHVLYKYTYFALQPHVLVLAGITIESNQRHIPWSLIASSTCKEITMRWVSIGGLVLLCWAGEHAQLGQISRQPPYCPNCGSLAKQLIHTRLQAALEQEARIAGFKSEVTKSQELHLASLTRDTERLTSNLEKIRAEIRSVKKPVSSLRLKISMVSSISIPCSFQYQPMGLPSCNAFKES